MLQLLYLVNQSNKARFTKCIFTCAVTTSSVQFIPSLTLTSKQAWKVVTSSIDADVRKGAFINVFIKREEKKTVVLIILTSTKTLLCRIQYFLGDIQTWIQKHLHDPLTQQMDSKFQLQQRPFWGSHLYLTILLR